MPTMQKFILQKPYLSQPLSTRLPLRDQGTWDNATKQT